jgi:hypothetical protein
MAECQTRELIVPKPTFTLVARLMWRLTGLQRLRVLANDGLQEVHLGACQQAVVDFVFAALADFQKINPAPVAALLRSLPDPTGRLQSSHRNLCLIVDQFRRHHRFPDRGKSGLD